MKKVITAISVLCVMVAIITTVAVYKNKQEYNKDTISIPSLSNPNYDMTIIKDTEDFYGLIITHYRGNRDLEGGSGSSTIYAVTDGEDIIIIKENNDTTANNGYAFRATVNIKDISLFKKLDDEGKFTYLDNLVCNSPHKEVVTDGMSNDWKYNIDGFSSVDEEFQYYIDNQSVTPAPLKPIENQ